MIHTFWESAVDALNDTCDFALRPDPRFLLLDIMGHVEANRHTKLFFTYATFYERQEILLSWKLPRPPTVSAWKKAINLVLPLYKIMHESRICPKKFYKVS